MSSKSVCSIARLTAMVVPDLQQSAKSDKANQITTWWNATLIRCYYLLKGSLHPGKSREQVTTFLHLIHRLANLMYYSAGSIACYSKSTLQEYTDKVSFGSCSPDHCMGFICWGQIQLVFVDMQVIKQKETFLLSGKEALPTLEEFH